MVKTFSLKYQARVLRPLISEKNHTKWVMGTNSLREENEICIIKYEPENDTIKTESIIVHENEIWDLALSPVSNEKILTLYNTKEKYCVNLWEINFEDSSLKELIQLPIAKTRLRRVLWSIKNENKIVTIEDGFINKWEITEGEIKCTGSAMAGDLEQFANGNLSLLDDNKLITVGGNGFRIWDIETMAEIASVPDAHEMVVKDVDLCRLNEERILTCSDDCTLKIWDSRKLIEGNGFISELTGGHTHWVWQGKFNPYYKDLTLSSSSDSTVTLWATENANVLTNVNSLLSAFGNPKLKCYDEHEDSVYSVSWSEVDPCTFASLSYDGRVIVNHITPEIKHKLSV